MQPLFAIEAEIHGQPPEARLAARQARSAPVMANLHAWLEGKRGDEAVLPSRGVNVLGQPGAGGFGLTLWIALTTTRRASGIAGSRC